MVEPHRTLQNPMQDAASRLRRIVPQAFEDIVARVILPRIEQLHALRECGLGARRCYVVVAPPPRSHHHHTAITIDLTSPSAAAAA